MFRTALISVLVLCVSAKWEPDPPPVVGTDETDFDSNPVVLEARKMAKLAPSQDVITTCRYLLFKEPLGFHEANAKCNSLVWPITNKGIGMATVQNQEENNDVKTLIRLAFGIKFDKSKPYKYGNWALIGLSKRYNNDRKLKKKEKGVFNESEWFYQNNEQARYGNFHNEMPDQQSKGKKNDKEWQNWVQVNKKGYWDDTYSSKALPFLCQYCGKYIVLSKHVTWNKAKMHCEDLGLQFAKVDSADDNAELLFAAQITLGEELGGRRFNNTNWVWIGEREVMGEDGTGTGEWEHYDNSTLNYSPTWDYKRQPDNWILPRGEQQVVAISRKNGKWDDSFMFRKRPFACMCPDKACTFKK